jgi:hypothetical protein
VFSLGTDILVRKWSKEVAKNPQNVFYPKSGPRCDFLAWCGKRLVDLSDLSWRTQIYGAQSISNPPPPRHSTFNKGGVRFGGF